MLTKFFSYENNHLYSSLCSRGNNQLKTFGYFMGMSEQTIQNTSIHRPLEYFSSRIRSSKGLYFNRFADLSYAFLFLILFTSLSPQPVSSVPTSLHQQNKDSSNSDISQLRPKWINPCGYKKFHHASKLPPNFPKINPLSEKQMLNNIVNTAYQALEHSVRFQSEYVKKTFSVDNWKDHHELWRDQKLGWLPSWEEIPKHLNEKTKLKHLVELEVTAALKNMYIFLQKIAVGLEQIVIDKLVNGGDNEEFIHKFNEAEYKLKSVLCEIQGALIEKKSYEDIKEYQVTRNVMPLQWRQMNSQHNRNLRDWLIYRDYMNGLEYIIDSFKHKLKKI